MNYTQARQMAADISSKKVDMTGFKSVISNSKLMPELLHGGGV